MEVVENVPAGTAVLRVSASDADTADAGRVSYFIQSGNEDGSPLPLFLLCLSPVPALKAFWSWTLRRGS